MAKWYVYKGVNKTLKEIYYGVSKDPVERVDGSHCVGGTKALRHWDCEEDDIEWETLGYMTAQSDASDYAHDLERKRPPKGWTIILTAGI